jgi:hypothetical protein
MEVRGSVSQRFDRGDSSDGSAAIDDEAAAPLFLLEDKVVKRLQKT